MQQPSISFEQQVVPPLLIEPLQSFQLGHLVSLAFPFAFAFAHLLRAYQALSGAPRYQELLQKSPSLFRVSLLIL